MNVPASQLDESPAGPDVRPAAARVGAMKFTYPSGSQPLEGYTIKRGVGRGGFGEVYFATSDAGKEVALKLIRRNLEVELRGVTQCLNLKHPNLIGLYDIRGDEMGDQWVIMEYVSGQSLEDVIERHPHGMPVEEALWWMRGMCAGVAYLHDHGIVHRDLKPGNVFCDEGLVKIGDYGLAKFISCSRRSGQTESVGTVHYMAPEIANGRYGREIDTYALGIILYEMLTGNVPFEGESVGEVLMKHLTAEPDLHRLEEPYREVVRRALAKDPDARIKSVSEMLAMLPGESAVAAKPPAELPELELAPAEEVPPTVPRTRPPESPRPVRPEDIEEPIFKALKDKFAKLRLGGGADGQPANPLLQAVVVFAIVAAIYFNDMAVTSTIVPLLICYGIYYIIWVSHIRPNIARQQSEPDRPQKAAVAVRTAAPTAAWQPAGSTPLSPASRYAREVRQRRTPRPSWREVAERQLATRSLRERISELLGSMLLAAPFAALAALVAPVLLGMDGDADGMAIYLWLALVGTLGSWAVIVPTKLAEGRIEDQVPMRIVQLILGGLVGVAAWALASALVIQLPAVGEPVGSNWGLLSQEALNWTAPGNKTNLPLAAYVTYFAFLFLLLRWWRQAEYHREHRLSVWTIAVCVMWAWLLQFFWAFPQPAGMMVAGVTAFATQLASPWLPPSGRRALESAAAENMV